MGAYHQAGWVEAPGADTHRIAHPEASKPMGIAVLNPFYELRLG